MSILETFHRQDEAGQLGHSPQGDDDDQDRDVRGLARMVQVSPQVTLVDLALRGVAPGTYRATIREYGNLAQGATSTGPVWRGDESRSIPRGALGTVVVGTDGRGNAFLQSPLQVWEIIGRAMVVSRQEERDDGKPLKNDADTVVGVVARSAGVWDNDKTVCSCTGKTLWEERKDEVKKGML